MTAAPPPPAARLSTSWDDYRYVRAVAQTRSLTGAADVLGVNHSTVFRRLNQIEDLLGVRLFERGRTGYTLTPAGEEMVAIAARLDEEIVTFERRVAGRDVKPSGELRVTINDTMMVHLMTPVFASFLRAYPDIRLDIVVTNVALNLSKRDADIAVRATRSPPENLVGRRISNLSWAVYGTPTTRRRDLVDLYGERWIGYGEALSQLRAARWLDTHVAPERIAMRLNTVLGTAEAVENGIGLGLLPCFIGDRLSAITRLSDLMPDLAADLWLLTHPDIREAARVRAFMSHCYDTLARMRPALEGKATLP